MHIFQQYLVDTWAVARVIVHRTYRSLTRPPPQKKTVVTTFPRKKKRLLGEAESLSLKRPSQEPLSPPSFQRMYGIITVRIYARRLLRLFWYADR